MEKLVGIVMLLSLFLAVDTGPRFASSATVATPKNPSDEHPGADSTTQSSAGETGSPSAESTSKRQIPASLLSKYLNITTAARNDSSEPLPVPASHGRTSTFDSSHSLEVFIETLSPSEGEATTLSCIVYDPSILTVSWYKNERLSTHDILAPAADVERMAMSHDIADDTRRVFNLTIEYLHSNDSGVYTCRAIHRHDAAVSVQLTVTYVPELHYPECYLNGKKQAEVTEGDNLRLSCFSEKGVPPWHLIWIRQQNQSIVPISLSTPDRSELIKSELSIVASREVNGATFICSLVCLSQGCPTSNNNGLRNCNIGPLVVNPRPPIEEPPTPIIAIDPGMQIASEGDNVEFSCSTTLADGNAVWFAVSEEEPPEDRILVSDGGSQLAIMNVKQNDTELMACGIFCQDKLITVGQVNLQVLQRDMTTVATEPTTTIPTISTSLPTTTSPPTSRTKSTEYTISNDSIRQGPPEADGTGDSVLIGAPFIVFFLLFLLVMFLGIVVRLRRHSYQRAATQEPSDLHNAV